MSDIANAVDAGFFGRHLRCGQPTWLLEERESTAVAKLPHLTMHVEKFDTSVAITWACTVCLETTPVTSIAKEDWSQQTVRPRAH